MEGSCGGYESYDYGVEEEEEEGCRTPTHEGSRIPWMAAECPPAPRKKRLDHHINQQQQKKKQRGVVVVPKDGYFQHPDLELLFKLMTTREPFVQFQSCSENGRPRTTTACYQI
ncbi:hypothetical protein ACH5RR_016673 [Cinchona calisaya]|uniref:Uncharacterized protein n=1 Tax=Cinchona calisaya TaxID=153742 RepID=A0ABD2ZWN8_9GENT